MPHRPSRQCPGRGPYLHRCPNLVKGSNSYCSTCSEYARKELRRYNRKYDQDRDQGVERKFIHSTQWRKIRNMKLIKDPLCERCLMAGRETRAVLVHHVDGNELNNKQNNHLSLCNDCHERIHKQDRWGKK